MRPALNIARLLAGRYAVLLLAVALVLGLFEFAIMAVVATFDIPAMLGSLMALMPPNIARSMELIFGGLSPKGLLGFGWDHPIAHTAGAAAAVVLGARTVAGEIENGTLELMLAQPISRVTYMIANIAFAVCALMLVAAAAALGTLIGSQVFDRHIVSLTALASAAINFALLLLAIYALTLLASSVTREGGRALGIGVLVTVLSFLARVVSVLWRDAAFLEPYSLHTYHLPRRAFDEGRIAPVALAVLLPFITLLLLLALQRFTTRDIP